jgi:hypothetical protein
MTMTKRTFEERIKFDHGFTINREHPVTLTKDGNKVRDVLVFIPSRGFPRVILKTHVAGNSYLLTTYRVKGNFLEYHGNGGTLYGIEQFDKLIQNPEATIEY